MSKAILVASFGTTFRDTRQENITAVEQEIALHYPQCRVYTAWTSAMVRKRLAERGEQVDSVPQAMERMAAQGVNELFVLPTHLLHGEEYDKLCAQVRKGQEAFMRVRVAPPLLACTQDMCLVADAVAKELPTQPGQALVLMGHGTNHFCNTVYAAMDYLFKAKGNGHIFVGTVEAYPDLETVLAAVVSAGYRQVLLAPLMLVAGDHAVNDMASHAPDSWKSRFEAAGIACDVVIRGLGAYKPIRQLYVAHLASVMEGEGDKLLGI